MRQARIVFHSGFSTLDAMVRNLSKTGARIEGDGFSLVPDEFELHISNTFGQFEKRRARKVWLRPGAMGVKFIAEGEAQAPLAMIA